MKEHVADGGFVLLNRRADGVILRTGGRTRHHVADRQVPARSCVTELAMHEHLVQEARDCLHGIKSQILSGFVKTMCRK